MITKMKKLTFLVYHKEYEAFLNGVGVFLCYCPRFLDIRYTLGAFLCYCPRFLDIWYTHRRKI